MYLFASLTSVFAWERVYPHKFEAVFRSGLRHSVQAQNLSVQSTAENLTCPVSLPEQKPASNFRVTPISRANSAYYVNIAHRKYLASESMIVLT